MKEASMATTKTENRHGVVPGVAYLALDVVDRGQSTAIAMIQDVRGELRQLADHGIELAEKATAALFRVARKITQRVDESTAETLTGVERLLGGAVRSARDTTRTAADLAHAAVGGIAGAPSNSASSAQA
jgi:hypothetical protein